MEVYVRTPYGGGFFSKGFRYAPTYVYHDHDRYGYKHRRKHHHHQHKRFKKEFRRGDVHYYHDHHDSHCHHPHH